MLLSIKKVSLGIILVIVLLALASADDDDDQKAEKEEEEKDPWDKSTDKYRHHLGDSGAGTHSEEPVKIDVTEVSESEVHSERSKVCKNCKLKNVVARKKSHSSKSPPATAAKDATKSAEGKDVAAPQYFDKNEVDDETKEQINDATDEKDPADAKYKEAASSVTKRQHKKQHHKGKKHRIAQASKKQLNPQIDYYPGNVWEYPYPYHHDIKYGCGENDQNCDAKIEAKEEAKEQGNLEALLFPNDARATPVPQEAKIESAVPPNESALPAMSKPEPTGKEPPEGVEPHPEPDHAETTPAEVGELSPEPVSKLNPIEAKGGMMEGKEGIEGKIGIEGKQDLGSPDSKLATPPITQFMGKEPPSEAKGLSTDCMQKLIQAEGKEGIEGKQDKKSKSKKKEAVGRAPDHTGHHKISEIGTSWETPCFYNADTKKFSCKQLIPSHYYGPPSAGWGGFQPGHTGGGWGTPHGNKKCSVPHKPHKNCRQLIPSHYYGPPSAGWGGFQPGHTGGGWGTPHWNKKCTVPHKPHKNCRQLIPVHYYGPPSAGWGGFQPGHTGGGWGTPHWNKKCKIPHKNCRQLIPVHYYGPPSAGWGGFQPGHTGGGWGTPHWNKKCVVPHKRNKYCRQLIPVHYYGPPSAGWGGFQPGHTGGGWGTPHWNKKCKVPHKGNKHCRQLIPVHYYGPPSAGWGGFQPGHTGGGWGTPHWNKRCHTPQLKCKSYSRPSVRSSWFFYNPREKKAWDPAAWYRSHIQHSHKVTPHDFLDKVPKKKFDIGEAWSHDDQLYKLGEEAIPSLSSICEKKRTLSICKWSKSGITPHGRFTDQVVIKHGHKEVHISSPFTPESVSSNEVHRVAGLTPLFLEGPDGLQKLGPQVDGNSKIKVKVKELKEEKEEKEEKEDKDESYEKEAKEISDEEIRNPHVYAGEQEKLSSNGKPVHHFLDHSHGLPHSIKVNEVNHLVTTEKVPVPHDIVGFSDGSLVTEGGDHEQGADVEPEDEKEQDKKEAKGKDEDEKLPHSDFDIKKWVEAYEKKKTSKKEPSLKEEDKEESKGKEEEEKLPASDFNIEKWIEAYEKKKTTKKEPSLKEEDKEESKGKEEEEKLPASDFNIEKWVEAYKKKQKTETEKAPSFKKIRRKVRKEMKMGADSIVKTKPGDNSDAIVNKWIKEYQAKQRKEDDKKQEEEKDEHEGGGEKEHRAARVENDDVSNVIAGTLTTHLPKEVEDKSMLNHVVIDTGVGAVTLADHPAWVGDDDTITDDTERDVFAKRGGKPVRVVSKGKKSERSLKTKNSSHQIMDEERITNVYNIKKYHGITHSLKHWDPITEDMRRLTD